LGGNDLSGRAFAVHACPAAQKVFSCVQPRDRRANPDSVANPRRFSLRSRAMRILADATLDCAFVSHASHSTIGSNFCQAPVAKKIQNCGFRKAHIAVRAMKMRPQFVISRLQPVSSEDVMKQVSGPYPESAAPHRSGELVFAALDSAQRPENAAPYGAG